MYKLFFIIGALASMIFHPEAKASAFTPVSPPGLQSRVTPQLLTRLLPHTSLPEAKASVFTPVSLPGLQSRVTSQLLTRLLPHTSLPEAKASVFTRFTPGASVPGYAPTSDKAFSLTGRPRNTLFVSFLTEIDSSAAPLSRPPSPGCNWVVGKNWEIHSYLL